MSLEIYIAVAAGFTLWNITTFALYGMDKSMAKNNKRRISESALISCAFFMGGVGAFLGMRVFRHKTKHLKFKILIPLAAILNIVAAIAILHYIANHVLA